MARKGAPTAADAGEPRRSYRIKDQAKPEPPPKKAPAKPRSRKPKTVEEGDAAEKEKPKSPPVNGEDAQPPAKKAKPDSHAASKPASKAAVTGTTKKPASKIAASEVGVKPASKTAAKPASRAGSRKPVSKAAVEKKDEPVAPIEATIAEEPEAEAAAQAT